MLRLIGTPFTETIAARPAAPEGTPAPEPAVPPVAPLLPDPVVTPKSIDSTKEPIEIVLNVATYTDDAANHLNALHIVALAPGFELGGVTGDTLVNGQHPKGSFTTADDHGDKDYTLLVAGIDAVVGAAGGPCMFQIVGDFSA